nr:MAG TPA: DNA polymerase phi [Caudoviricetes sp.]
MNFLNKYAKRSLESADTTDNQTTDDAVQLDNSDTPVENSGERVEVPDTTDNLDTGDTNTDEPNLGGEGETEPAGDTGDTEPTDGEGNGDNQEPDTKPEEDKGDDGDSDDDEDESEEEATDEQKEEAAAELESFREQLVNDYIDGGVSNEDAAILDGHISRILKRVGMGKVKVVPSMEHFSSERRVIATNVLIDHLDQVIRKLRR